MVQALAVLGQTDPPTPVVLWHGMGDSAAGMIGIQVIQTVPESLERVFIACSGWSFKT